MLFSGLCTVALQVFANPAPALPPGSEGKHSGAVITGEEGADLHGPGAHRLVEHPHEPGSQAAGNATTQPTQFLTHRRRDLATVRVGGTPPSQVLGHLLCPTPYV